MMLRLTTAIRIAGSMQAIPVCIEIKSIADVDYALNANPDAFAVELLPRASQPRTLTTGLLRHALDLNLVSSVAVLWDLAEVLARADWTDSDD